MAETLDVIKDLPDISFIDDATLEQVQELMITTYQESYRSITGQAVSLARGDPIRVILLAVSQVIYQHLQLVDKAGKMNFLKYAYGDYLDQLAATRTGLVRKAAEPAVVTILWSLEAARASATPIPEGTRLTADGSVFFATTEYLEIPAGETELSAILQCTVPGAVGNGYAPGEVDTMVDPVPFIASVSNVDASSGGSDTETDEELAQRVFLAPSGFSVAGPADAYVYRCLEYSSQIVDVAVSGPGDDPDIPAGTVDIRILMEGGEQPEQSMIDGLTKYLTDAPARPLTDTVQISGPDEEPYSVSLTYYIAKAGRSSAASIQTAVAAAVEQYEVWQSARIGRDINPDELIARVKAAGAKRAVIASPAFTTVPRTAVPVLASSSVTYGGLEDD